jgi:hypothetical protein
MRAGVTKIFVDCRRDGKLIASYEYGLPIGLLPGTPPDTRSLIEQSKSQLTTDRVAFPQYDGITFRVRYP